MICGIIIIENKIKEVEKMGKYSNNQIEYILKSNGFKKSKNNSFYKVLKKRGKKFFKVRVSNHNKHHVFENEILINYVFKSNKDLNKILKKLINKFKLIERLAV